MQSVVTYGMAQVRGQGSQAGGRAWVGGRGGRTGGEGARDWAAGTEPQCRDLGTGTGPQWQGWGMAMDEGCVWIGSSAAEGNVIDCGTACGTQLGVASFTESAQ